jgi:hypothetical protein
MCVLYGGVKRGVKEPNINMPYVGLIHVQAGLMSPITSAITCDTGNVTVMTPLSSGHPQELYISPLE